MSKPVFAIICASFLSLTLSGCGYFAYLPDECINEVPTTFAREYARWRKAPLSPMPTKSDFLKAWGKPDKINSASVNEETWIYERHHAWCGVMPWIIIPIPLLLPVCDEFERIYFEDDHANRLHIRRIVEYADVWVLYYASRVDDPVCRYTLPIDNKVDSKTTKPDAHVTP